MITCCFSMLSVHFEFDGTKEWWVFWTSRTTFAYFRLYLYVNVCKRMQLGNMAHKIGETNVSPIYSDMLFQMALVSA